MNTLIQAFEGTQDLWKALDRVRYCLAWEHEDAADRLRLTLGEYHQLRSHGAPPPAIPLLELCEDLRLDFRELSRGRVDVVALERHLLGDFDFIPDRYMIAAFSRRRTSLHLIDFLDRAWGEAEVDHLLRKFQVRRSVFERPDSMISIRFLTELCEELASNGVPNEVFVRMGSNAAVVNRDSPLGDRLRQCRTLQEAFDLQVNQLTGMYDNNHRYRFVKLTETSCVIESADVPEVTEGLGVRFLGNPAVCAVKMGVGAAVPGFFGLTAGSAVETHCVHRGDAACRMMIDFSLAQRMLTRRGHRPETQFFS